LVDFGDTDRPVKTRTFFELSFKFKLTFRVDGLRHLRNSFVRKVIISLVFLEIRKDFNFFLKVNQLGWTWLYL